MRRTSRPSVAVLGFLSLLTFAPASAQEFPPIEPGKAVRGTLTRDEPSFRETPFSAYAFEAAPGKSYLLELRSRDFDAFLTVGRIVRGLTEYLVQNDDAEGTDSRIYFRPDEPGRYVVVVAATDGMAGGFDLMLDEAVSRAARPQPIALGASADGRLGRESGFDTETGQFYDLYVVELTSGQELVAALDSDVFDAYLGVGSMTNDAFEEVAGNDDAGGTNSLLRWSAPSAGTWYLRVSALGEGGTGAYKLTAIDGATSGNAPPTPITSGASVDGTLELADRYSEEFGYYDDYAYDAMSVHRLRIDLSSEQIDPRVYIGRMENGAFVTLAENDDGEGLNSRLRFTLPAPGRYIVRASSSGASQRGPYTLALAELPPATPRETRPVAAGVDAQGMLDDGDYDEDEERAFEQWRFSGTAGQSVVVRARSFEFDTTLSIGRIENGVFTETDYNDDGPAGTDSELRVTVPASGELIIRVSGFSGAAGSYTLRIDP